MSVSLWGNGQTVLQTVSSNFSTYASTTSSTPVSTGFSASITPFATTSKILVLVNSATYMAANGVGYFFIYRGGSSITSSFVSWIDDPSASYGLSGQLSTSILDSPATTSSITYTIYFSSGNGVVLYIPTPISGSGGTGSITLLEISGA